MTRGLAWGAVGRATARVAPTSVRGFPQRAGQSPAPTEGTVVRWDGGRPQGSPLRRARWCGGTAGDHKGRPYRGHGDAVGRRATARVAPTEGTVVRRDGGRPQGSPLRRARWCDGTAGDHKGRPYGGHGGAMGRRATTRVAPTEGAVVQWGGRPQGSPLRGRMHPVKMPRRVCRPQAAKN